MWAHHSERLTIVNDLFPKKVAEKEGEIEVAEMKLFPLDYKEVTSVCSPCLNKHKYGNLN